MIVFNSDEKGNQWWLFTVVKSVARVCKLSVSGADSCSGALCDEALEDDLFGGSEGSAA